MGNFQVLIDDLESAIQEGQQDKRIAILRRVTDLFVVGAHGFGEDHITLFGNLLTRLTHQVENRVLAELSAKLAPVANAPNAIIQRFARHEEIAVAGPALTQSPQLSDTDLIEIAKSKGQMHLGAISERVRLAEPVTDVLVERGDTDVVRKLSLNHGAAFSRSGFDALANRAQHDEQLAENLGGRVDLPPDKLRRVMARATEQVRARLLAGASPERRAAIQKAIDAASAQVEGEMSPVRDFRRAKQLVEDMKQRGQLNEAAVEHFAGIGQYELMVASLAQLCLTPVEQMDPLMRNPSYEGLLTACRACDLGWRTFSAILQNRFPGRPTPLAELEQARADFHKMAAPTAKRVYSFWLARSPVGTQ